MNLQQMQCKCVYWIHVRTHQEHFKHQASLDLSVAMQEFTNLKERPVNIIIFWNIRRCSLVYTSTDVSEQPSVFILRLIKEETARSSERLAVRCQSAWPRITERNKSLLSVTHYKSLIAIICRNSSQIRVLWNLSLSEHKIRTIIE